MDGDLGLLHSKLVVTAFKATTAIELHLKPSQNSFA